MQANKLFLYSAFLILVTTFISCNKDDDNTPADPVGTVTLNMMNEDNGKTELGHSDVYIDNANNFYSKTCLLSHLGKKSGLGSVSDILPTNGTNTVAVELGSVYQFFKSGAIKKFPSGKLALNMKSDYYNVYVVSHIKHDDGAIIGANVKFILMDVPDNGLPEYDSFIGTIDHRDNNTWEITVDLPTSDFEYESIFESVSNKLEYEKVGSKLVIRLVEYGGYSHEIGFYIRIKDSYTYVSGNLQ